MSGLEPRDVIVGVNGVSMFGKDEAALAKVIMLDCSTPISCV